MPDAAGVTKIWGFNNGMFATGKGSFYKWYGNNIRDWQVEIFRNDGNVQVLGSMGNGLFIQGSPSYELVKTVDCYKLSYESTALGSSRENPFNFSGLTSPKSLSSSLKSSLYSHLFPGDNTYNKLLVYRKQHKQVEFILEIIKPAVMPNIKFAWDKIKMFSNHKSLMSRTVVLTFLPVAIERTFEKQDFLLTSFAFDKINDFSRAKRMKESEINKIVYMKFRKRVQRLEVIFKKLWNKERGKYGSALLQEIKTFTEKEEEKLQVILKILQLSKKVDVICLKLNCLKWRDFCTKCLNYEKAFLMVTKLFINKQGGYAIKLMKAFKFYQSLKLHKLLEALKIFNKRNFIQEVIYCFNKWCKLRHHCSVRKVKSDKIYTSLGKNIYSVLNHQLKRNLKYAFNAIAASYFYIKLSKKYRSPLLYFTTVVSKIICRLKFSAFSSIHRSREKNSFTLNLGLSDMMNGFWYILQKIYMERLKSIWKALCENLEENSGYTKESKNNTTGEQTLTFFKQICSESENPFSCQVVPKLPLQVLKTSRKPPTSIRKDTKLAIKLPWKAPNRSGSYGGSEVREDSLSRRKNYDNQLRKKLKNNDKFSKKIEEVKEIHKLIPSKSKTTRYLELKPSSRDTPKSFNDVSMKSCLAALSLARVIEKCEYDLILSAFRLMKSCYKVSRASYSRCYKCSPEKQ